MASSLSTVKPDVVLFARGVISILETWPALKLAVAESWGGPESIQKRRWLASEIVQVYDDHLDKPLLNPLPDAIYLEEMLLQVMSDEFETNLEDESAERVGKDVVKLWQEISGGGENALKEVERLEKLASGMKGKKVQVQEEVASDDDGESGEEDGDWSDEDDEEGEEEAPRLIDSSNNDSRGRRNPEPEVDEDGFTTVKRKR